MSEKINEELRAWWKELAEGGDLVAKLLLQAKSDEEIREILADLASSGKVDAVIKLFEPAEKRIVEEIEALLSKLPAIVALRALGRVVARMTEYTQAYADIAAVEMCRAYMEHIVEVKNRGKLFKLCLQLVS